MTEPTEPEGVRGIASDAPPDPDAAPDRLPTVGQSIVACRALAAPVDGDFVEHHVPGRDVFGGKRPRFVGQRAAFAGALDLEYQRLVRPKRPRVMRESWHVRHELPVQVDDQIARRETCALGGAPRRDTVHAHAAATTGVDVQTEIDTPG